MTYLYGIHVVMAVLRERPQEIRTLYYVPQSGNKPLQVLLQQAMNKNVVCKETHRQNLDEMTQQGAHQGIVVECPLPALYKESAFFKAIGNRTEPPFILALDGVQDPHNLGACLRTAEAAGVHGVIIPQHNAVGLTPVVCKVSAGAAETVPLVVVTNLVRTLKRLQEERLWLYGLVGGAKQSLYSCDFTGGVVLVLGAEGKGLRPLTMATCDYLLHIPMQGSVSSVNVSVAAGISCFEVLRQRGQ